MQNKNERIKGRVVPLAHADDQRNDRRVRLVLDVRVGCDGSNSYTLVLNKHGELLYDGVSDAVADKLHEMIARVVETHSDLLVVRLVEVWDQHKLIMTMIRDILMYMVRGVPSCMVVLDWNQAMTTTGCTVCECVVVWLCQDKTFCKLQKKTPVYDMGLLQFRDKMVRYLNRVHAHTFSASGAHLMDSDRWCSPRFAQVRNTVVAPRLLKALLDSIRRERDQEVIDRLLMKNALVMLWSWSQ
jgi:hypothetical protein